MKTNRTLRKIAESDRRLFGAKLSRIRENMYESRVSNSDISEYFVSSASLAKGGKWLVYGVSTALIPGLAAGLIARVAVEYGADEKSAFGIMRAVSNVALYVGTAASSVGAAYLAHVAGRVLLGFPSLREYNRLSKYQRPR